ncbi:MAG: hypothetical protein JNK37_05040 [Verrucomicrobiales bacterium]|nr:hypothetical protein [Verrucomicrobiales bacterium]
MKPHRSRCLEPGRLQRIRLHWRCPWRNWREARFHLKGIFREVLDR